MTLKTARKKIKKVAEKIAKEHKPEKIILFGSYAWGRPDKDSDVDLFIIKKTRNTRNTAMKIDGSILPRPFAIDILVYRPEQVKKRLAMEDYFIKDVVVKGKILYEAKK